MKILLVGGGGREHALAWKLAQSKNLSKKSPTPTEKKSRFSHLLKSLELPYRPYRTQLRLHRRGEQLSKFLLQS